MKDEALEETLEPTVALPQDNSEAKEPEPREETTSEHEEKIEKASHWVDEMFTQEQDRLKKQGISDVQSWIKLMAGIDKALTEHPKETLGFLSQIYGITISNKPEAPVIRPEIIRCLQNLEQNQIQLWQELENQKKQTQQLTISNFASAKDDNGRVLHPHFQAVKDDMLALINSGMASNYESAYEKALWINPQTRAELQEKQEAENLQALAEEADKAKSAGFSPKGGLEKEDFSTMTTREILEHTFKKLKD